MKDMRKSVILSEVEETVALFMQSRNFLTRKHEMTKKQNILNSKMTPAKFHFALTSFESKIDFQTIAPQLGPID